MGSKKFKIASVIFIHLFQNVNKYFFLKGLQQDNIIQNKAL